MSQIEIKQVKNRILIAILLIIATFIFMFVYELFEQRHNIIKNAERQTAGFAKALSQHAERTFAETERVTRDTLHDIHLAGEADEIYPKTLYDIMKFQTEGSPQIGDMFIVDEKGKMFNNTATYPPKMIDVSDRDYFKFYASTPNAGVTLGTPVKSRLVGRWRFNLMRPLAKQGEPFNGLLAVAFEVEYFKNFLDSSSIGKNGKIILLHTNGKPLVYEPYIENAYKKDFNNSKFFKEILPQKLDSGTFALEKGIVTNTPLIVSYTRLKNFPVIAVVALSKNEVLAKWHKEFLEEGIFLFMFCLSIGGMGKLVFSYINRLHHTQNSLNEQNHALATLNHQEKAKAAILEKITLNAPLKELLTMIVSFVENQSPGSLCSVLLADTEKNILHHAAAISLPQTYNQAVDGLRIANKMGSCGTAAFLKKRVIVEDIAIHPFWKGFTPAHDAGLRSCWSEPIVTADGELLGTFAIYHKEPRSPLPEELLLIESAANLANIAISRLKTREQQQQLEEQLRHIQKIDAVGQLAGGIAHDLNNLLTPILVYGEMIKKKLPPEISQHKQIDGILLAAHKAKDLNQRLLSFSRKQILCLETLELNHLIGGFKELFQRAIPENMQLDIKPQKPEAYIYGDKGQIEQALLNLVINAKDAICETNAGNGKITIETSSVLIEENMVRQNPGMNAGQHILLKITDNGCGMTEEQRRRIFEPFFTTKEVGKGTGLGLAMVYGLVKQHNGYIAVESEPGNGTSFMLYFPAAEAPEQAEESHTADNATTSVNTHKPATILLVEDNDMIREMTKELLQTAGFTVYGAELPSKAILIAREHPEINLMVSDVVMPEMNGQELHERLQFYLPALPVIFMSGYTNNVILHDGIPIEGYNFIHKPFTAQQMLEAIQSVMGQET